MSRNYYSEINLHVTWHVKASMPLLVAKLEAEVHHYIRGRCISSPGVFIHEIGGTDTHIHVCLSVPPTLTISDFVGQLKGSSSHDVNQKPGHGGKMLEWQAGMASSVLARKICRGSRSTSAINGSDMAITRWRIVWNESRPWRHRQMPRRKYPASTPAPLPLARQAP